METMHNHNLANYLSTIKGNVCLIEIELNGSGFAIVQHTKLDGKYIACTILNYETDFAYSCNGYDKAKATIQHWKDNDFVKVLNSNRN